MAEVLAITKIIQKRVNKKRARNFGIEPRSTVFGRKATKIKNLYDVFISMWSDWDLKHRLTGRWWCNGQHSCLPSS